MRLNKIILGKQVQSITFDGFGFSYTVEDLNYRNWVEPWFTLQIGPIRIEGWA